MKAITLFQPYAHAFSIGDKKIETRGWITKHRGITCIHASKKKNNELNGFENISYGAIVAVSNLIDCVPITSDLILKLQNEDPIEYSLGWYNVNRYAFIFKNTIALPSPIQCRGNQKLWNLPFEYIDEIKKQIDLSDVIKDVGGKGYEIC